MMSRIALSSPPGVSSCSTTTRLPALLRRLEPAYHVTRGRRSDRAVDLEHRGGAGRLGRGGAAPASARQRAAADAASARASARQRTSDTPRQSPLMTATLLSRRPHPQSRTRGPAGSPLGQRTQPLVTHVQPHQQDQRARDVRRPARQLAEAAEVACRMAHAERRDRPEATMVSASPMLKHSTSVAPSATFFNCRHSSSTVIEAGHGMSPPVSPNTRSAVVTWRLAKRWRMSLACASSCGSW